MSRKTKLQLAALLTALTIGGACGDGKKDNSEMKSSTGLGVADYAQSKYIAETVKKDIKNMKSGKMNAETSKSELIAQKNQLSQCSQRSFGQSLNLEKDWERNLDSCSYDDLAYGLNLCDFLTRLVCYADSGQQLAFAIENILQAFKSVQTQLDMGRPCTASQQLEMETVSLSKNANQAGESMRAGGDGISDMPPSVDSQNSFGKKKDEVKCMNEKERLKQIRSNLLIRRDKLREEVREWDRNQTGRANTGTISGDIPNLDRFDKAVDEFNRNVQEYREDCGDDIEEMSRIFNDQKQWRHH